MRRFLIVFCVAGVLFGGLVGFLYVDETGYAQGILASVLVGLGAGASFGAALGGVAWLFTKLRFSALKSLALLLILIVTGAVVGGALALGVELVPRGRWTPVASTPEKTVRLLTRDFFSSCQDTLYVQTESGEIYSCSCSREAPCAWKAESAAPAASSPVSYCPPSAVSGLSLPTPPLAGVVDSYDINLCGPDGSLLFALALRKDGTLWTWEGFRDGGLTVGLVFGVLGGSVIGLLSALAVTLFAWRKNL